MTTKSSDRTISIAVRFLRPLDFGARAPRGSF
jgi:hypothetical protein